MQYNIGDIVRTKKQHPCGSKLWELTRVGVDFKLKCQGCGHVIVVEREKALKMLQDEVPHGIFVEVEKMKQRKNKNNEDIYDIEATIYCLKNSHKGIIIGKNGEMLKRIGRAARIDMEKNFGVKVNLKTWVKVKEDWQDNNSIVSKFKLK